MKMMPRSLDDRLNPSVELGRDRSRTPPRPSAAISACKHGGDMWSHRPSIQHADPSCVVGLTPVPAVPTAVAVDKTCESLLAPACAQISRRIPTPSLSGCLWTPRAVSGSRSPWQRPAGYPFLAWGEKEESTGVAEQLALAWALVWALDRGLAWTNSFIFAFDNTSAGGGAFGTSLPPGTDTALQLTPLSLRLCLAAQATVAHRHVRAHTGILGNEIVDVLAKEAARQAESVFERCLPRWPARLARHALHPWAWMCLDNTGDLPALFALPSEASRLQSQMPTLASPPGNGASPLRLTGSLEVRLCLITYNILTLLCPGTYRSVSDSSPAAGMRMYGKRDLLKQQLDESGAHFVALQETRVAGSQELPDADYFMLHSSCTASGQFGMAVWLHKRRAFHWVNGRPAGLDRQHLTVLVAEPRLLIVQVACPAFKCILVAAHAPHTLPNGDGEEAQVFWSHVSTALRKVPASIAVVVLAIESSAVGSVGADPENASGTAFHYFLQEHDLSAANTFQQCHVGAHMRASYLLFCTEHSSKVGLCGCSDFLALWCSDKCPPSV